MCKCTYYNKSEKLGTAEYNIQSTIISHQTVSLRWNQHGKVNTSTRYSLWLERSRRSQGRQKIPKI